ncbi:molybdopterin-dependent oxidoreductase [Actinosynnema sp. NPDC047251]|uniref:Molybdopterin binding domain-containing oxidoreductase n=1 Tax=Saccharothrix espanaensis (strain ATCC 51144 / DSM 44229 / JCM 9112 / NBRC 15066 / NRRL 15764) TaxID=1179773 RepID=K0K4U4_SACES|nr:molybdopterin-dependent oxidoreductase [Saccharothrix espanaensis]CCH35305.1 Molybdopterin binding domain-containing oxidoreductase [Saccharothrix espanaensis DSM 44229]
MSRWTAALIGLLGVAAALAAGHLVAGLVGPTASPFLAVGNTAIDFTPTPLKDFAVRTFGTYDKLVLLVGMAVVIAAVAVVAGLLSRTSPLPGTILATALGALGVAAVLYRPDLGQLAVLAPVAAGVVGVLVFRWLHRAASAPSAPGEGRRTFLIAAGASVLAGLGGQFIGTRTDVEGSRSAVGELKPTTPAPAIPAGADFVADGTPSFITPNRDFYRVDTALSVPRVLAEDWTLRVHGLVDRELTLSYDDLRRRDLVERTITMTCVSNEVGGPYVSTANFVGVPLRDVLLEAGIKQGADQLFSTSVDGWTAGSPVDVVLERDRGALIALGMNGEPLPVEHGFPARLVVPGLYGYLSATKWVVDLELTTFADKRGYWLERGWGQKGPVKVMSRIDTPQGFATVRGRAVVSGVAWAQPTGVGKVEVRTDGGPWRDAELATAVNGSTWRMWRAELDLPAGGHTVECRATDLKGFTQPAERVAPIPDGATGWHSIFFTIE